MELSKQKIIRMVGGAFAGLIFGGTLGFLLGGVFGAMGSLFGGIFNNDLNFLLLRIIFGCVIGGLIGASVIGIGNRALNGKEKTISGVFLGLVIGLFTGIASDPTAPVLISFELLMFAGMIGITAGGVTGVVTAIYIAARSRDSVQISVEEKTKNDEYASYMKQRLNK